MKHLTTQQLSASLDDALFGVSLELVRRHISICADCTRRRDHMARIDTSFIRLFEYEPGEEFFEDAATQLETEIEAEARRGPSGKNPGRASSSFLPKLRLAAPRIVVPATPPPAPAIDAPAIDVAAAAVQADPEPERASEPVPTEPHAEEEPLAAHAQPPASETVSAEPDDANEPDESEPETMEIGIPEWEPVALEPPMAAPPSVAAALTPVIATPPPVVELPVAEPPPVAGPPAAGPPRVAPAPPPADEAPPAPPRPIIVPSMAVAPIVHRTVVRPPPPTPAPRPIPVPFEAPPPAIAAEPEPEFEPWVVATSRAPARASRTPRSAPPAPPRKGGSVFRAALFTIGGLTLFALGAWFGPDAARSVKSRVTRFASSESPNAAAAGKPVTAPAVEPVATQPARDSALAATPSPAPVVPAGIPAARESVALAPAPAPAAPRASVPAPAPRANAAAAAPRREPHDPPIPKAQVFTPVPRATPRPAETHAQATPQVAAPPATSSPAPSPPQTQAPPPSPAKAPDPAPDASDRWPLLCGEVVDDAGMPVAGARVVLADLDLGVRTDRRGRFCLSAPPGDRTVSVIAMGFAAWRDVVSLSANVQTMELKVRLKAAP